MRTNDQILKDYIDVQGGFMMKQQEKATILNPKLILEVLLDIRELIIGLNNKKK